MPYELTRRAQRAEQAIVRYRFKVAGYASAARLRGRLKAAYEFIADNPGAGSRRPDLTPHPYRFVYRRPYWIVYEAKPGGGSVTIIPVVDARRDVARLLRRR